MSVLLCTLCENTSLNIDHSQNILGYIGFGVVIIFTVIDTLKKKKEKEKTEQ